jgi:hypothetical protein
VSFTVHLLFDLAAGAAGLLLVSPLLAAVAAAVAGAA